jgi:hypothetical protein
MLKYSITKCRGCVLERMRNDDPQIQVRYYPGICLGRQAEHVLNTGTPKYEKLLTTPQRCSFLLFYMRV